MEDAVSQAQTLRRALREIGDHMGSVLREVASIQQGSSEPDAIQNLRSMCEGIAERIEKKLKPNKTSLRGEGRVMVVGHERLRRTSGTILRRVGYEVVEVGATANLPLEDGRPYDAVLLSTYVAGRAARIISRWPSAAIIFTGPADELARVSLEFHTAWQLPDPSSYLALAAVVASAVQG